MPVPRSLYDQFFFTEVDAKEWLCATKIRVIGRAILMFFPTILGLAENPHS